MILEFKIVHLLAILMRKHPQTSFHEFLSIGNLRKKSACYQSFKNEQFVRGCTEKTIDDQYMENVARKMYSNHNQMKSYCVCYSNQCSNHNQTKSYCVCYSNQ